MSVGVVTMMLGNISMDARPPLILVSSDDAISSDGLTLSDSDPKDSGIDCDADIPDPETTEKITKQIEFYLSDANILKDPFLLKHVRRNKEGYVSLKLLASFRKVRSLSRSWKAVAHSVRNSTLLVLNRDGTKVRRVTPLPDHDETAISRSILVSGIGSENPSSEISDMFSKFGDISLVRILRPGGSIPPEVKRLVSKNHPDMSSKVCALVEFEEHSSVKKAMESKLVAGITVIPVLAKEKAEPGSPKKTPTDTSTSPPKELSKKKKKKNKRPSNDDNKKLLEVCNKKDSEQMRTRSNSSCSVSSGYLSSSPSNAPNPFDSKYPRRHSFNPTSIYNDPKSSFASLSSRHQLRGSSKDRLQQRRGTEGTLSSSPWRRRREQMMLSDSNLSANSSSSGSLLNTLPVQTIRMPRGPDGTNGFCTRPRLPSTTE